MKQFIIQEPLAQAILNYLAERPYKEVFQLVMAMQVLKEVPNEDPAIKEVKK